MSGGRYPVLRSLAIIYLVGAALAAVSTVLTAGYFLFGGLGWTDKLIAMVGTLTGGFLLVVTMLAFAEVLKLFIDVEHNTRMAAPGRTGMPAAASMTIVAAAPESPAMAAVDGGNGAVVVTTTAPATPAHINRLEHLDEETAEAALLRGH
jgi:hypothetical protein